MASKGARILAVSGGIAILWIGTVAILTRVIPGPHQNADYLVMGAAATFLSMLLLFVVLLQGWVKADNVFYKRRIASTGSKTTDASREEPPSA